MVDTKQVRELLYMSPQSYNECFEKLFFAWCTNRCQGEKDNNLFQKIIANTAVSKWYNAEYEILEEQFVAMIAPQHGFISCKDARTIYHTVVSGIFQHYPLPLIEAAKTLNINSN